MRICRMKYVVIFLFIALFCTGCGIANVKNEGPQSNETVVKKDEGPSSTWTIVIEDDDHTDKDRKKQEEWRNK